MVRVKEVSAGVKCGHVFGTRTVIGKPFSSGYGRRYAAVCKCECGIVSVVGVSEISRGAGCQSCSMKRHGDSHTPLHGLWHGIRDRCHRQTSKSYCNYGARGIQVCQEWRDSYEAFRDWALANGYEQGLQIDRRDNDGNYCQENCRFVTGKVNSNNRRNNRWLEAFGERKTFQQWSEDDRCHVTPEGLAYRVDVLKWTPEECVATPNLKKAGA